nr:transposase, mutator type [Tanacetum cinerariifolium]
MPRQQTPTASSSYNSENVGPAIAFATTDSTLFSIKLHYGGVFTISPNMKYNSGIITFVDLIDSDQFSVHEIDFMLEDLGQDGHRKKWNGTTYKELLWRAAKSTTVPDFQLAMEALKEFSSEAYEWIVNVNKLIDRCVTPTAIKILRSNSNEARKYTVDYAGDDLYQGDHPKKGKKSAAERDVLKIVKNGKLSREHNIVTCNKCNTEGHNLRSCTRPRDPKSNKRKVPSKGMDDTDAPVGSQSKKKATTQAARFATSTDKGKAPTCSQSKDKGKAPTTTTGVPKKTTPRKKIIKLG